MSLLAPTNPTRSARPTGWVPFALVALVAIPAVAGSLRLVELAGGPLLLPANTRMTASPLPVFVHVLSAVPTHRAWMTRAYAIALAAGTQTFTLAIGPAVLGPGVLAKDVSLGAAWLVNLAVAEVVIRRAAGRRPPVRLLPVVAP